MSPKRKKIIAGIVAAAVVLVLAAAFMPCSHEWQNETCTQPKTCTKCEAAEGDPLGHDWKEATCTQPKTCDRCKATEGKALGHEVAEWTVDKEPSCTEAGSQHGTCIRCEETITSEIPKTKHIEGEWATAKEPTVNRNGSVTPGEKNLTCATCGTILAQEPIKLDLTISQKNAMRTAQRYLDTMGFSYSGLIDQLEYEKYSLEDATFAADHCGADWNEQAVRVAQRYINAMSFSRGGLIDQLEYEGFSTEQAAHGADAVGLYPPYRQATEILTGVYREFVFANQRIRFSASNHRTGLDEALRNRTRCVSQTHRSLQLHESPASHRKRSRAFPCIGKAKRLVSHLPRFLNAAGRMRDACGLPDSSS